MARILQRGEYMGVTEAARRIGITTGRIRQMLIDGTMKGVKVGRNWLITTMEVDRIVHSPAHTGRPRGSANHG